MGILSDILDLNEEVLIRTLSWNMKGRKSVFDVVLNACVLYLGGMPIEGYDGFFIVRHGVPDKLGNYGMACIGYLVADRVGRQ